MQTPTYLQAYCLGITVAEQLHAAAPMPIDEAAAFRTRALEGIGLQLRTDYPADSAEQLALESFYEGFAVTKRQLREGF